MDGPNWLSIPLIDAVIQSNWWPIMPITGYAIFRSFEYLVKRKIEDKPQTQKIDQYIKLAELQEKLDKNKTTISDLDNLRAQALGGRTLSAINLAEGYANEAAALIKDASPLVEDKAISDDPITVVDMTELASRKADEADRDLSSIVFELISRSSPEAATALKASQEAWEAYRRLEAEREAQVWEGGSMRPMLVAANWEALSRERIARLLSENENLSAPMLIDAPTRTPTNLFRILEPGIPQKRVENILGVPNYSYERTWLYCYINTQVEISFNENKSISSIVMAICEGHIFDGFLPGDFTSKPLGKLTVADILPADNRLTIRQRFSARTQELYIEGRYGPSGAWSNFCYGSLVVCSGVGRLKSVDFEWDYDHQKLASDPSTVLINWVASTDTSEAPDFYWFIR